jgi:hypothetical protein
VESAAHPLFPPIRLFRRLRSSAFITRGVIDADFVSFGEYSQKAEQQVALVWLL